MDYLPSRLYPSITGLRCFVAAAKYLSFTKAGLLLNMSQSAVSKQIQQLEENLNLTLFERSNHGLFLNPQAQDFLKQSINILSQIESSIYQLYSQTDEKSFLNIVAHPSLCTRWLLPQIQFFKKFHPHIQINIYEQIDSIEINLPYIDVAFLYGVGNWSNKQAIKLFNEECIAVASPALIQRPFSCFNEFLNYDLIHLQSRIDAWRDYFTLENRTLENPQQNTFLDSFNACIQAAILGYGIALVPNFFVQNELASNQLIKVWNDSMLTENAYYLTYDKSGKTNSTTQQLIKWFSSSNNFKPHDYLCAAIS